MTLLNQFNPLTQKKRKTNIWRRLCCVPLDLLAKTREKSTAEISAGAFISYTWVSFRHTPAKAPAHVPKYSSRLKRSILSRRGPKLKCNLAHFMGERACFDCVRLEVRASCMKYVSVLKKDQTVYYVCQLIKHLLSKKKVCTVDGKNSLFEWARVVKSTHLQNRIQIYANTAKVIISLQ